MEYLLNNKVIKNFADQYSEPHLKRAIKAALIYGIQSMRKDFRTTHVKLPELEEVIEEFFDRKMNQLAKQTTLAEEKLRRSPIREQIHRDIVKPKKEAQIRRSTVYSDSYSPPKQRAGKMLLTEEEAQQSMKRRLQQGVFTHRNDAKEVKFDIDRSKQENKMTKPSSSWRKGDQEIFYRNVPINPWKREHNNKRVSNSVQSQVYPKWWGGNEEEGEEQPIKLVPESGGTTSGRKERLRSKSFEQDKLLSKKPPQMKKSRKQDNKQNPLYVRTCDQHKNKTKLTNPFKSTYHHRGSNQPTSKKKPKLHNYDRNTSHDQIKMRKMPINLKTVESKIRGQVMKDKQKDRVQRIIDQQIGKQSARVQIKYPPYKSAPIRQPSPAKKLNQQEDESQYYSDQEQEDGYEPGESKNEFNEQSEFIQPPKQKQDLIRTQQYEQPDVIANKMLNSPFMSTFQDPSPQVYQDHDGRQRQHKRQGSSGVAPQKLNPQVIDSQQYQKPPPYYHPPHQPTMQYNRPYRYKEESSKEPSTIEQRARQTGMSDLYNRPDISSVYTKSPQNAFDRYIPSSGGVTQTNFNPHGYQGYPQQMMMMMNNPENNYYQQQQQQQPYNQQQVEQSKQYNPHNKNYAKDTSNSALLSSGDKSINKTPGVISSIEGLPAHAAHNENNLSNLNSQTSPGSNYLSGEIFDQTNNEENDPPHNTQESPQIPKNSRSHKRNAKKHKKRNKNQTEQKKQRKKQCDTWVGQYVMRDSFPRNPNQLASSNKYTYNVAKNSGQMRRSRQGDYSFPSSNNITGSSPPLSNYNQKYNPGYSQASFSQPHVARSNPNGITNYSGFSSDLGVRDYRQPPPPIYKQQPQYQAPLFKEQQYDPYNRSSYNFNKGNNRFVGEPLRRSTDKTYQQQQNFSAARNKNILDDSAQPGNFADTGKSPVGSQYNPAGSRTFEEYEQNSNSELTNFTPSEEFKGFFKKELGGSMNSSGGGGTGPSRYFESKNQQEYQDMRRPQEHYYK